MIVEPKCYARQCKHLLGVKQPNNDESIEFAYCSAFEDGIPDEIAYGNNLHKKPLKNQDNDIVYEMDD